MSKFKVGDPVEFMGTVKGEVLVAEPDSSKAIVIVSDANRYFFAREDNCTIHSKTQDWFGVEIDAFDSKEPESGQPYWLFDAMVKDHFYHECYDNDKIDKRKMALGYWLNKEKAKRSAPLMYKRMCEMAKTEP